MHSHGMLYPSLFKRVLFLERAFPLRVQLPRDNILILNILVSVDQNEIILKKVSLILLRRQTILYYDFRESQCLTIALKVPQP